MRSKLVMVVMLMSFLALRAADKYQPLDVKTGLWEVTTTVSTSGQIPISPDLLEQMTPEQRARLEQRMSAKNLQPSKPIVSKHCLTQEQLDKGLSFADDRKSCQHTLVSSTRNKAEIQTSCVENDVKFESKLQFEAINPKNVNGQTQTTVTGGDRTMNSNSTLTAKWLSSDCGTTK